MSSSLLFTHVAGGLGQNDATSRYYPISGGLSSVTATANAKVAVREAGTMSNFFVRVTTNTHTTADSVFSVERSSTDELGITFAAAETGIKENTGTSTAYVSNDEANIECVTAANVGTTTITIASMGVQFNPTDTTRTVSWMGVLPGLSTSSEATWWLNPNSYGDYTTTETNAKYRVRGTFTASNFYVTAPTNAKGLTFKTRVNGADGNQLISFAAAETGTKEDTTNTDSLVAGDDYYYQVTTGATAGTSQWFIVSTKILSTADEFMIESARSTGVLAQAFNVTNFMAPGSDVQGISTTETDVNSAPRFNFTAKELSALVTANTIATSATVVRTRVNLGNGSQSLSYAAGETGVKSDSVNTDVITGDGTNEFDYSIVTPNTSGSISFKWVGVIGFIPALVTSTFLPRLMMLGVG